MIDLLDAGAAPAVVIAAAIAVNARLVLYSATMAPHWRGTSPWWQALAAYLLVEPSLAVGLDGYEPQTPSRRGARHLHYLGGASLLWVAWLACHRRRRHRRRPPPRRPAPRARHPALPRRRGRRARSRRPSRVAPRAPRRWSPSSAIGAPLHLGVLIAIAAGIAAGLRAEARPSDERLVRRRRRRAVQLPVPGQHARARRPHRRPRRGRARRPVRGSRRLRRARRHRARERRRRRPAPTPSRRSARSPPAPSPPTGRGSSQAALLVGMPTLWVLTALTSFSN